MLLGASQISLMINLGRLITVLWELCQTEPLSQQTAAAVGAVGGAGLGFVVGFQTTRGFWGRERAKTTKQRPKVQEARSL